MNFSLIAFRTANSLPFSKINAAGRALQFWREAGSDKEHEVPSLLAVKLFSVRPHAMSVERVFSTMGWINSARRGSMTTKNLEMATKVYLAFRKQSKLSRTLTDFSIENLNALSETSPDSEDFLKDYGEEDEVKTFFFIILQLLQSKLIRGFQSCFIFLFFWCFFWGFFWGFFFKTFLFILKHV